MAHKHNPFDLTNNDSSGALNGGSAYDLTVTADPQALFDGVTVQSHGMVAGETVQQLTEDWWTWALQAPVDHNPLLDTTGTFANVNNSGPVFFLAGSLGGDVSREFSVPGGTPLLLPIINGITLQNDGKGNPVTNDGRAQANQALTGWQTSVADLSLVIDGHAVGNLQASLVRTDFFSLGFAQPGSLLEALGSDGSLDLTKEIAPSKSFGYWEVVQGLGAGTHTLDFGATNSNGSEHVHDILHVLAS